MLREHLGVKVTFYSTGPTDGYYFALNGVKDAKRRPSLRAATRAAKKAIEGGAK